MSNIKTNKARCLLCSEIIESKHLHDFITCGCGNISVDGGTSYLKRSAKTDQYEDLSEAKEESDAVEKRQEQENDL